jgi:hypothetical protein
MGMATLDQSIQSRFGRSVFLFYSSLYRNLHLKHPDVCFIPLSERPRRTQASFEKPLYYSPLRTYY